MLRVKIFSIIFFLVLCYYFLPVSAQEATPTPTLQGIPFVTSPVVSIIEPLPGQVVQGVVTIKGSSALKSFTTAELTFAYENNPSNTWFIIQPQVTPVVNGPLAEWDTTTITDGVYALRLVVTLADGSQKAATVSGLRVNNYTPIEANQYKLSYPTATIHVVNASPTAPPVSATALPTNSVSIARQDVKKGLGIGVLTSMVLITLFGLVLSIRSRRFRQ